MKEDNNGNNSNNNKNVAFEQILKHVPTFCNIILEARYSPIINQWEVNDYRQTVKWAEYFEKVLFYLI